MSEAPQVSIAIVTYNALEYIRQCLDSISRHTSTPHEILVVDTTFRSGRVISDAVNTLKEVLRRNLDMQKVRIASVYWNPDDDSTWTVRPFRLRPDYYLKKVDGYMVYPQAPYRMRNPRVDLKTLDPRLHEILYGEPEA